MPTDALPLRSRPDPHSRPLADIGSPWRRLYWTLPLALAICALVFGFFSYSMERASPRPPETPPVDAQIVELPAAPLQRAAPEQAPPPPEMKPPVQPDALPQQAPPASPQAAPPAPAQPAAPVAIQSHAARTLSQPMPVIPDDLRDEAMHETATARFHIAADGSATVELIRPTGNPQLNRLLLKTLKQWKFDPAIEDGKAAPSTQDIVIRVQVD
jgi:periplasmic protein TonB